MSEENTRNNRKELVGVVRAKTGDKSVKVVYQYKTPHPLYKKEIRRKTTVHVHDEANEFGTTIDKRAAQFRSHHPVGTPIRTVYHGAKISEESDF